MNSALRRKFDFMKLLELLYKRETAAPMLALAFATAVSTALVLARIVWTENLRYAFLVWNLFLAWLPLLFSLLACEHYRKGTRANLDEPTPDPSKEGSRTAGVQRQFPSWEGSGGATVFNFGVQRWDF